MNNYPKMLSEVIEAIETHFDDNKDIITNCMLYLKNVVARDEDFLEICRWFNRQGLCEECGTKLITERHKEPHPELGYGIYEIVSETFCPECEGFYDE